MSKIALPQLAWYGMKKLELSFPENWWVDVYNMKGHGPGAKVAVYPGEDIQYSLGSR